MKPSKAPTPLQLFKQWKKYNLASEKARYEKRLLDKMTGEVVDLCRKRITVNGFIYELTAKGFGSWNKTLEVTKLGSVEEFIDLVK